MLVIDWYLTLIARFMGYGIDGAKYTYNRNLDPRIIIGAFFAFLPLIILANFSHFDVDKHPTRYALTLLGVIVLAFGPPILLFTRRKQIKQKLKKVKPIGFWRALLYILLFFAAWWLVDAVWARLGH